MVPVFSGVAEQASSMAVAGSIRGIHLGGDCNDLGHFGLFLKL
jgi:hypothetical protein